MNRSAAQETENFAILSVLCSFFSFESWAGRQLSKHMSLGRPGGRRSGKFRLEGSSNYWLLLDNNVMASILFRLPFRKIQPIPKMPSEITAFGEVQRLLLILCIQWVLGAIVKVGEESIIAYLGWNRTGTSFDVHCAQLKFRSAIPSSCLDQQFQTTINDIYTLYKDKDKDCAELKLRSSQTTIIQSLLSASNHWLYSVYVYPIWKRK